MIDFQMLKDLGQNGNRIECLFLWEVAHKAE